MDLEQYLSFVSSDRTSKYGTGKPIEDLTCPRDNPTIVVSFGSRFPGVRHPPQHGRRSTWIKIFCLKSTNFPS